MLVRQMNVLPLNKKRGIGGGVVQPTKKKHVIYFRFKSVQFSYFVRDGSIAFMI